MELTPTVRLKLFTHEMVQIINEQAEEIFSGNDGDPEVLWSEFRQRLKILKKEHIERYNLLGEEDDDSEQSETEFQKWKKENIEKYK